MGGGSYSYSGAVESRVRKGIATNSIARSAGFAEYVDTDKSVGEVFTARSINNAMSPHGIVVRESCDSAEHPNSLAIIIALDETGSMGNVPHHLVKEGLPSLMDKVIKGGEPDPQVLFLGIGDHECDRSPLQVGQFESSNDLLDRWLLDVFLEGKGGGNYGESYALAWYFAARHTKIDCFEKRGRKGLLFTIGDEPVLKHYPARALEALMGPGQYSDETADGLLAKAVQHYDVFHVHIRETGAGSRRETMDGWRQLLHDRVLVAERHQDVAGIIADAVLRQRGQTVQAEPGPTAEAPEDAAAAARPKIEGML